MTSKLNAKVPTRHAKASGQPASANPYAPSVPISLYREVAAELQATRATLDTLKNQNQQLVKQNQQLRQEIEKVVQSALQLRQVTNSVSTVDWQAIPELPSPEIKFDDGLLAGVTVPPTAPRPRQEATQPAGRSKEPPQPPILTEDLFIEQESSPQKRWTSGSRPEVGGWWLAVVILLIVVTAFGTGFLIVRPLLSSPR